MVSTSESIFERDSHTRALHRLSRNQWEDTSLQAAGVSFRHTEGVLISSVKLPGAGGAPAQIQGALCEAFLFFFLSRPLAHSFLQPQGTTVSCYSDSKS